MLRCIILSYKLLQSFIYLLLLFGSSIFAQSIPAGLDSLIVTGKEQMYNLHFEQAEKTFVEAQSEFPDYPHGYVYQAYIAAIVYSMDRKDDSLEQILNRHIEQASEVAEDYKDRMEETADSHFYLGLLRGIKALAHATNRSYIKAYWDGRKAKSDLEKTVDLNPEYYDAYLGLGLFQYYVALLPGVLKFFAKLLGFEGDRYKAMQQIELSAEEGQYFRVEAEFLTHSTRYFLEGDTTTTIPALKKMYEEYPENQAIGLLLAYHYRRYGFIQKCIDYCKSFTDEHGRILPLITNLKYYNLAVSYYDLNQFQRADSLLEVMIELPTRKSRYYEAAIAYYKGHLADLHFKRDTALAYYQKIKKSKRTKYWFNISRMLIKHPTDSLMYKYFVAKNLLDSRQHRKSLRKTKQLVEAIKAGKTSVNPNFKYLVYSLLGRNYHSINHLQKAEEAFARVIPDLDDMEDEFRRAWVYIHYNRYLRSAKKYDRAEEMLDRADDFDDEYSRIIIERERFILNKKRKTKDS